MDRVCTHCIRSLSFCGFFLRVDCECGCPPPCARLAGEWARTLPGQRERETLHTSHQLCSLLNSTLPPPIIALSEEKCAWQHCLREVAAPLPLLRRVSLPYSTDHTCQLLLPGSIIIAPPSSNKSLKCLPLFKRRIYLLRSVSSPFELFFVETIWLQLVGRQSMIEIPGKLSRPSVGFNIWTLI